MKGFPQLATAVLLTLPVSAAQADLILVGTVSINGTGLGAVNTVLTITSQANNTTEQGCVIPTGGANFGVGNLSGNLCSIGSNGDLQNQTQTRNLGDVGILSGSAFGVVFNASEPGGNSISLDNLVAYFRDGSGNTLSAALACGGKCDFASTEEGTGKSGVLFQLNNAEAADLQTFITNAGGASNVYVGLGAAAGSPGFEATGGLETFFVFNAVQGVTFSVVPEPSTTILVASGFVGLAAVVRRRRRV
jgi:hypothetical protein